MRHLSVFIHGRLLWGSALDPIPTSPQVPEFLLFSSMPSVSQVVPPFPPDLPTASLVTLDFDLLQKNDPKETERLFISCRDQGFLYLENHRVAIADAFQFGRHLFSLPLEEKEKYAMGDGANYLGYKHVGGFIVDSKGTPDSNETWNVLSYILKFDDSSPRTMHLGYLTSQEHSRR